MSTQLAAPAHRPNRRLTTRQREFAKEYVSNGFNARKAAITVGYNKKAAVEQGSENLSKPHIRQLVDAARAAISVVKGGARPAPRSMSEKTERELKMARLIIGNDAPDNMRQIRNEPSV